MNGRKRVLGICGSTRKVSANLQLLHAIASMTSDVWEMELYDIAGLPHFNPDLDGEGAEVLPEIDALRNKIKTADGVLICTPEYVFSLPGSLKNLIEWTVSTTVFSEKPVALITASALGEKAHEALQLIMRTIYADLHPGAQLHISGIRSKLNKEGEIVDEAVLRKINELIGCFTTQMQHQQKAS